mgnify:CR=1 FL=1|jgi:hypothetical protein
MALRKQKSRKQQVADLAVDYLKIKTATKAAKGAKKAASKTPIVKRIPVLVGAGVAALVATKVVKSRGGEPAAA